MAICLDKALLGAAGAGLSYGIDKLAQLLTKTIQTARIPMSTTPPILTALEANCRPGMSAIALTSSIISRLGEAGIDTGTLPDGSEPQMTACVRVVCEEAIKEFQLNAKIMVEPLPGMPIGTCSMGPVVSTPGTLYVGIGA